jgi:hypothetical protein
MILFAAAASAHGCSNDLECSLNGLCVNSKCECDAAWHGATCNVLTLLPAATENGYRQPNTSSWGGSVIRDGDTYHMFVEELVYSCGLNAYVRNMRIAHAVSDRATGPYRRKNLVASYSASTPHAVREPGGAWLVFGTGCGVEACLPITECAGGVTASGADMYPCPNGTAAPAPTAPAPTRPRHAAPCSCSQPGVPTPGAECSVDWGSNVWRAPTADGPWTLTAPLLDVQHPKLVHADGTPVVFANPSALLLDNGTAALMYRDYLQKEAFPATNVIGLAWSRAGWRGPYEDVERKIFPDSAEDPHVYRDKRGHWHMLAHPLCAPLPRTRESLPRAGRALARPGV